ncbi:DUF1488 family protein [Noviherbaspirillum soli]|uniref:DUF1488 family protein n=1 Tax=Noviherbaspirillum soli TaxID=1064518 RepID=UPI001E543B5D|nr:DUF1488 family protein [Noviherbaspirillum soli]
MQNAVQHFSVRRTSMPTNQQETAIQAGLWFSIKIDADEFIALLSAEALEKHFLPKDAQLEPRSAYRRNRKLIDAVARRKFLEGCPRPITVDASDFNAAQ